MLPDLPVSRCGDTSTQMSLLGKMMLSARMAAMILLSCKPASREAPCYPESVDSVNKVSVAGLEVMLASPGTEAICSS